MNQFYELSEDQDDDLYQQFHGLIKKQPWTWQCVGAVTGTVGGVAAPVVGTILIVITWLIPALGTSSFLSVLTIVLFALPIPLLVFGAHCLDRLERMLEKSAPDVSTQAIVVRRTQSVDMGARA